MLTAFLTPICQRASAAAITLSPILAASASSSRYCWAGGWAGGGWGWVSGGDTLERRGRDGPRRALNPWAVLAGAYRAAIPRIFFDNPFCLGLPAPPSHTRPGRTSGV